MSDLIDFDSPNSNEKLRLALPLIPAPESNVVSSDAGPQFSVADKRRSIENNPFDMVMAKVTEYEKNQEDPFERVCEKAMMGEPKDDLLTKRNRRFSDILKMNKTLDETDSNFDLCCDEKKDKLVFEENDMSIITDLNNTNLIEDGRDGREVVALWSCDNKMIPNIKILPTELTSDSSISKTSAMNNSRMDCKETLQTDFNVRPRSMSQNAFLSPKMKSPLRKMRSLSVNDEKKDSIFQEDCTLASTQSSMFNDPLNNAFRKTFLRSNTNSSSFSVQYDSFVNKQKTERLNSDSSVFSGVSSVSTISMDSDYKMRLERFWSENSTSSGISDISVIPTINSTTSYESFEYSNNTINKAFVASKSQLDSANSNTITKKTSSKKADKSDLINRFFEIKSRISSVEQTIGDNSSNLTEAQQFTNDVKQRSSTKKENLINVDNSFDSVFNEETNTDDIIVQEARRIAASFKIPKASDEEELFVTMEQPNFKDLSQSDNEIENNLIELPISPQKGSSSPEANVPEEKEIECNELFSKEKIKALETEFIEPKDPNKKAMAASLLLELENLIKKENNPEARKILTDLEKLLGVDCDNNTEVLKVCLQKTNNFTNEENSKNESHSDKRVPDSNSELTTSNEDKNTDSEKSSSNPMDILKSKQNGKDNHQTKCINENVKIVEKSQVAKQTSENKENLNEVPQDQQLAVTFLHTLNKIVNEKDENSAVNVLRSLSSIINMATELKSINKGNENFKSKKNDKAGQKQLSRSTNSSLRSPSPKPLRVKPQNKSYEILSQRRSIANTLTYKSNSNLLEIPLAKDRRKSELLNIKKRFPSDPGLVESLKENKKIKSPNVVKPLPSPESKKQAGEQLKNKLKKKTNPEVVTKKGPLKAVIPVGNMQKRVSIAQIMSANTGNVTPPKTSDNIPPLKIPSSTPISNVNTNKSKPVASSTPNSNVEPKSKVTVTTESLKSSLKEAVNGPKINSKRMDSGEEISKVPVPRYSPRPARIRNKSLDNLKPAAKSPQSSNSLKSSSEKKIQRHSSVLSPLRNYNKLTYKAKPLNLASKLGKPGRIQAGPEKENYG